MKLDGAKVLVSGDFDAMSRDDVLEALRSQGAVIASEIAPDVEIVFAGSDPGSEVDTAMELGIRVEDGDALRSALSGEAPAPKTVADPVRAPAPPAQAPNSGASSDGSSEPASSGAFEKGSRVRIVGGREGVGEVGDIFWWGDSKFGEGMRAGVTAESGEKYWVDEADLAWPDAEVDEEKLKEAIEANVFGRGDRIKVKSGKETGAEGTIFWWGESKWGEGMRAGVETDDGEKLWIDAEHLEAVESEDEDESDIPF